MKKIFKSIWEKNKFYWSRPDFFFSAMSAFAMFFASLIANFFAGVYTFNKVSNGVTDLILDRIHPYDVRFIVVQAAALFIFGIVIMLVVQPQKLPFTIKAMALFVLIRSGFVVLTHMAPPLGLEYQQSFLRPDSIFKKFAFGGDLFFSGHTGVPFLMALMYWHNKYLRALFLVSTVISGSAVLLGHLHYSIDVFGALFITYTILAIAKSTFRNDYLVFNSGYKS